MQSASPRKHATVSSEASSPSPPPSMHTSTHSQQYTPSNVSEQQPYQVQPLKEAVSMAFDRSDASHQISPDLVAHITEQVLSNLRMNGIGSTGSGARKMNPAASLSASESTASAPPRNVYTPPSPDRDELSHVASHDTDSQAEGLTARLSRSATLSDRMSTAKEDAPPFNPNDARIPASGDPTTLEKIWQPLFTDDGKPTARLGQLLRGIALHIIEDFEPKNSLVITPQKMLTFYDQVRLSDEVYPWSDIFGGKITNSSLSHIYRDLDVQHHFVQRKYDEKPNIPSLTPAGFQRWMTVIIRAHPEEEFLRLAKVAMDMPVSNADDRKERFPKQLSRRLFPKQPNRSEKEFFQDSILADPAIELPRPSRGYGSFSGQPTQPTKQSQPPPPPPPTVDRAPASAPLGPAPDAHMPPPPPQPSYLGAPLERERKPYSASSSEAAVDDLSTSAPLTQSTSIPIERDRKPYYAQPGGGKMYDSDDNGVRSSVKPRSNTMTGDVKEGSRTRPRRTGSQSGANPRLNPSRRVRSPSVTAQSNASTYARSEGAEMPPSSFSSTNPRPPYLHDDSDNELDRTYSRDSREERARRRRTMDVHASYPTQPKPIFDPPQYQRQQSDATGVYGTSAPPGAPVYPPPPRYA